MIRLTGDNFSSVRNKRSSASPSALHSQPNDNPDGKRRSNSVHGAIPKIRKKSSLKVHADGEYFSFTRTTNSGDGAILYLLLFR